MDRPNRIANITIGTNETMDTVRSTPISPAPQPHWNTATTAP
ncbi:MAG: hypothetical protein KatS3mg014_0565 [Actinomycetota bacterium]|nr:MAG: hypothetical protein KatS3mg014_0565 [Actinomycetota bacterium]